MSRNRSRILCLLLFETTLTFLCGVVAIYIRFQAEATDVLLHQYGWLKVLLLVAGVQGCFFLFDLYDFRLIRKRFVLYIRIFQALGLAPTVLALIFYALPQIMLRAWCLRRESDVDAHDDGLLASIGHVAVGASPII